MSASSCVILPTRNEEANIGEVLRRLDLLGVCEEIVVVDDSDDSTARLATHWSSKLSTPVTVHHRGTADRHGGLGTAIVTGINLSSAQRIIVMDADLQHPPELVPSLIARLDGVDLVIASRFNWDNVVAGLSPVRRVASRLAGALAFKVFPGQLRDVSDPMSGFFAIHRTALDTERLKPFGYKILLEILGTHPDLTRAEVPFSFGMRGGGESNAGATEGWRYLKHLVDLRRRSLGAVPVPVRAPELI